MEYTKNKISDVKGKENEQKRKGFIRNKDIDLDKNYLNYDLVESNLNLYQRVKKRVEEWEKINQKNIL